MASTQLARRMQAGFAVPDADAEGGVRWLDWGITRDAVTTELGLAWRPGRGLEFGGLALGGMTLLGGSLLHGPPSRPVTRAWYELPATLEAHLPPAFEALCERWETLLGSTGAREDFAPLPGMNPASRVRARCTFELDGVQLTLASWGAPRERGDQRSSGGLWLECDELRLAGPYLATFRAEDAPFYSRTGEVVARFEVPALQADARMLQAGEDLALHYAMTYPERRALPPWLGPEVAPETLVHWRIPDLAWGLAGPEYTLVFEADERPDFEHVRLLPARGRGSASLGLIGPHTGSFSNARGHEGFDALARHLARQGCRVTRSEYPDA